jgi:hypothetical protein
MSDAIRVALESAIRTYEALSPGVMTVERKQAIEALQALQHSAEPVAVADNGVLNWIDGKQFNREADLYTAPQPVVDQQLLGDIVNLLIAVKGAIKLGRDADACNYINAAIAAAQESYTYSPDGKMRINKNGNFGF